MGMSDEELKKIRVNMFVQGYFNGLIDNEIVIRVDEQLIKAAKAYMNWESLQETEGKGVGVSNE